MLRQVLVYGNRKQDDIAWDASTPEKRKLAFLALFNYLDKMELYADLDGAPFDLSSPNIHAQRSYHLAKAGDPSAAETFLCSRIGNEYESWHMIDVWDPLEQCA